MDENPKATSYTFFLRFSRLCLDSQRDGLLALTLLP
jgi:hypothetical protein